MVDLFALPLAPLIQNIEYCLIVALYSHLFSIVITGIYRVFGNGTSERIKSDPIAACIWRLGLHWLGAVIGIAAILGVF